MGTGPSAAFEGTKYLYVEASEPTLPGDVFSLESPAYAMSTTASFNITFMYHMFGLGMGGLLG